jgi:uncharacterized peroxidase-related enzyme
MTAWIRMIPLEEATGTKAHSLRPHTMEGHVALYRSVLHTPDNTLPFWFLEVIASYTSSLNQCLYSFTHHFTNARRLINDKAKSDVILAAMDAREPEQAFSGKHLALMRYAGKLTTHVGSMQKPDVDALHAAGCDDGEILEVNQVCAYFNYSNRLLNGLGVTTEGDVIGYYSETKEAT